MLSLVASAICALLCGLCYMDNDYTSRRIGDWFNGAAVVLFISFLF